MMKFQKTSILILGIITIALGLFYIYGAVLRPRFTADTLCKKAESCLYGLTIAKNAALELNFSNNGKYLLGRGLDGTRYWERDNKYKAKTLEKSTAIATAIDGRFAIATKDQKIKIFNEVGENLLEFSIKDKTTGTIKNMVFAPGFDIIAMPIPGIERGKPLLTFWSTRNGEFISKLNHESSIDSLAASAQGIIAVGQFDGNLILWPLNDLSQKMKLTASTSSVHTLAFDKSGKLLATGSANGEIKLWDASSGQLLKNIAQLGSMISGLAISSGGKTLASSTADGQYKRWDIESGELMDEWQYSRGIKTIALSPDGQELAIALERNVSSGKKRIKNPKSYGPKWVEVESTQISPAAALIRDLSKLNK